MGFLGEVEHTLGMEFPGQVEAVHVAFGAAGGDVAPGVVGLQAGELGEVKDDLSLEPVGVGPVVGAVEGSPMLLREWLRNGMRGE